MSYSSIDSPVAARNALSWLGVFSSVLLFSGNNLEAKVTRLEVDCRSLFSGTNPQYEILRGRAFGEIDPQDRRNSIIQDLDLATRNSHGMVEYISTFTLTKPVDVEAGNGVLFYAIANRGQNLTPMFNIAGDTTDFFQSRGFYMLSSGWQGDLLPSPQADRSAANSALEAISVPRVKNADGSTITGPYLVRIPTLGPEGASGTIARIDQGRAGPLSYFPVSYDTASAHLAYGPPERIDGQLRAQPKSLRSSDWMWIDCRTANSPADITPARELCVKLRRGRFDPRMVYTLTFSARDPLILGMGLAAMRDLTSFFRYSKEDDKGNRNPLDGRISKTIAQGISQSGNVLRTFIRLGFNEDEAGRIVWDGVNNHVAGRFAALNYRFALPGASTTLYVPGSEAVLWWGKSQDTARGIEPSSLLDRCERTSTCPRVFETFGSSELWNQRMSIGLVGTDAKRDIPLPGNVRRYYFPGTTHAGGRGGFSMTPEDFPTRTLASEHGAGRGSGNSPASAPVCTLPQNPNPQTHTMRALLVALTAWVTKDILPPPSQFPTLKDRTLTLDNRETLRTPRIPGLPSPYGRANPTLFYDFGTNLNVRDLTGYIDVQPPQVRGTFPALVATVDGDGNETSGIPSVLHLVPLGTYLGWNVTKTGPYRDQLCSFNGGFIPFSKTQKERARRHDPRPSIEERYGTRDAYVCLVKKAADSLISKRFLLREDADRLVNEAILATQHGDLSLLPNEIDARTLGMCAQERA